MNALMWKASFQLSLFLYSDVFFKEVYNKQ